VKSSTSRRSASLISFTASGRLSIPKPMCRDSSRRMYWQICRSSGSFDVSASIRNSDTANVSATSCRPIVFTYQRESPRSVSKSSRSLGGIG
jgi:hypothetical protein